ncbi:hypothetical protein L1049_004481 [Liquidambar formosana]|uniref:3'-5' exonuclease domain-containing protein n=1 Tax=Liquidambar formosana TaxID=63359 RepID=A0AAP0RPJ5_LIQFO
MAHTHLVFYSGKIIETTVTYRASLVDDWVRHIRSMYEGQNILVGLDLDYIPESIASFVSNPNITFVGVEVEETITKLRNEYGLCCINTADIRALAKRRFPLSVRGKPGLKAIANQLVELHMRKPKHICKRNWESRVLDKEQIEHACVDAYAIYRIGHKLLKEM